LEKFIEKPNLYISIDGSVLLEGSTVQSNRSAADNMTLHEPSKHLPEKAASATVLATEQYRDS